MKKFAKGIAKKLSKPLKGSRNHIPAAQNVNPQGAPSSQKLEDNKHLTTHEIPNSVNQGLSGEPSSQVFSSNTSSFFSSAISQVHAAPSGEEEGPDHQLAAAELQGEPLRGHTRSVNSVSFSPDGTRIVTGSSDNTVRLWDAATEQPGGELLQGPTSSVLSVSFSPDGTRIVTGSSDNTVRLWDAATGQPVGEPLRGHTDSVNSVSFLPDGTRIVTGSEDKTVRLWDVVTRQPSQQCAVSHPSAFSDEHCPIEATTTMKLNAWNNRFISFSSNSIHALCNTSELTEGTSHDDCSLTSFVLNGDSGWVAGPKDRLLSWVPPASRHTFYNPETMLVILRECPELDLSRMAHGQYWQKCREEP